MKTTAATWLLRVLGCMGTLPALATTLPELRWDPGAEQCDASKQLTQVQAIDESTFVIRQNPCIDYEANFLYLLLGADRALLLDSGASDDARVTAELVNIVSGHLARPGRRLPLVVAHTHGHQDHRAGDAAFAALPQTTVVPHDSEGLRKFFGFTAWPDQEARFDLGQRELVLVPTPGHHEDHIVFFDGRTRLLFTGDYLLPGRLLVQDLEAYQHSARRMVEFVTTYGVEQALGAHVEMAANGEMYPAGTTLHADERPVALPYGTTQANALVSALADFNGFYSRHPDYAVVNPIHNLLAMGAGVVALLAMVIWLVRRWRLRIKARRAMAAG